MNLRDLHYLVTLADQQHFGKAAELCHTSQPTLSIQIKKLEEFLGVQLFERSNKHVLLTAVGEEIVLRARFILEEAAQIKEIATSSKNPLSGTMTLGAFPTLAPYIFPHIVPLMREHFPQVTLVLVEEKTEQLLTKLQQGEIDCALLALPVESDRLIAKEVLWEAFYLAVAAAHPFAQQDSVALDMLNHHSLLLLDDGHCLREQSLELCARIGSGESTRYRATSLETLRNMIAAGTGMTFMPELAVKKDDKDVRYIPFASPAPGRRIGLVYRKASGRQRLFERVSEVMGSSLRAMLNYT
jgi:LysR family hydrogen peroxide-inducible transcriptional activator